MSAKHTPGEYRTVSCGCCNDGCCCWAHKPYLYSEPKVCAYHAQHGHPRKTGVETRAAISKATGEKQ